jgi:hypothetical protein
MNNRQYTNRVPDILKKTEELMDKYGVPIRDSWRNPKTELLLPPLVFVAGEEFALVPMDDGSLVMEVGEECRDDKRLDPVVNMLVLFLHKEEFSQGRMELAARFIQIIYRFQYNKNTVKGLFFYCKMNNIKNGDRYKEALAMTNDTFTIKVAESLSEICRGIII